LNQFNFDTIDQVESFLQSVPKFSSSGRSAANFSLDRMVRFCDIMGNPQQSVRMIHVAGTNGKGTTCQMLASVYQQAVYKTGLYTSPHLIDVRERFRINGENIADDDLLRFFQRYGVYVQTENLTFFEITTGIAFWYFEDRQVDLAVIETGLGGKLDATNVIEPEISVITSVGLDHTDILGDTIVQIAREKAGIIKHSKPVVAGVLGKEAMNVVEEVSGFHSSELLKAEFLQPILLDDHFILTEAHQKLSVSALGRKEIDKINLAMSRLVVQNLMTRFPVKDWEFIEGIERMNTRFAHHAHFEKLHPELDWYFDGAHNIQAIEELTKELKRRGEPEEWTVVLSFMQDKINEQVAELWKTFPKIFLFEQSNERAAKIDLMKKFFPDAKTFDQHIIKELLTLETLKRELVIFSGSFYFYNTVRHWMGTEADKK